MRIPAVAFPIAVAAGVFAADAPGNKKPNLVVIFTDDQVHNAVGYDNPEVRTPHLDALAAEGVVFGTVALDSAVTGSL